MTLPILVALGIAFLMMLAGGLTVVVGDWYRDLRKPSWNPPKWAFGPAWAVILTLAGWSGGLAWDHARGAAEHWRVGLLFGVNVVLHVIWGPLFFNLRRPDWALIEIPFVWLSILALIVGLAPLSTLSSLLLLPYLLWVSFATVLNYRIVQLNRPGAPA
jgi:tryptophan-rich sensory protein